MVLVLVMGATLSNFCGEVLVMAATLDKFCVNPLVVMGAILL